MGRSLASRKVAPRLAPVVAGVAGVDVKDD